MKSVSCQMTEPETLELPEEAVRKPELYHGQLVLDGSILYEVCIRQLKPGDKFRGRRLDIKEPIDVTIFQAYNPKRRAIRQLMREYSISGSRIKVKIQKSARRQEKRQAAMQAHIEKLTKEQVP